MQDTATPDTGETKASEALGTEQQPATGSSASESESKTDVQPVDSVDTETNTKPDSTLDPVEVARLQKELDKRQMEINMLRNREKEEEIKRLEDQENYKELADKYRSELEAAQAAREQEEAIQEARRLRDDVINSYGDPKTVEAAKKLLSENDAAFNWGDAETVDQAKGAIQKQLDTLRAVVSPEQEQPEVHSNNPAPQNPADHDRSSALEEAAQKRDFSKLLEQIPSVKAQLEPRE